MLVLNYEIKLLGIAGPAVHDALADCEIAVEGRSTTIRADLADQAALHGLLERIRDLGIEVLEVRRLGRDETTSRS